MRAQTFRRLSCALLVLVSLSACGRGKRDDDDKPKANAGATKAPTRTPAGDPIVRLDPEAQTRIGLRTQPATAEPIQPEIVAFGRLEEDPSRVFLLRAPVAGTLHAAAREWPRLGERIADRASVGAIEPRLAPAERISLTNQLAAARADFTASTSAAAAAKAAYERARALNADNKNVSDRVLEEAAARAAAEDAKVKTAEQTVRLLENSLQVAGPTGFTPLTIDRGGDVVEVLAQPGEAVEPGTPIVRVAKFDRLLARVDIPIGERIPPTVSTARIVAVGYEDHPMTGERVALAAKAVPTVQGESVLFRVGSLIGLRPGLAVTARIPGPGPRRSGILIPASAVVRVSGNAYAFVQTAPNEFVRKQVALDHPAENGFVVSANFAPNDRLVVQGGQLLLSEEFKSQLAAEADRD
jgi:membrane fusion protein, multidrug efflux system